MKQVFKNRFKKFFLVFLTLFALLFMFRLIYGYTKDFDNERTIDSFFDNVNSNGRKNYASKEYKIKSHEKTESIVKVDQKYEKIAEIRTKSSKFETEEISVKSKIKKLNALIQFEQKSGNKGYRRLNLLIGVPPDNFDSLYDQLIEIGKVQGKRITKKDKTNQYKELNAKKQSLVKIRTSLIDLKSKGGKIEEYMGLENRILEIEQQLQGLGVSLGDFDTEMEFCTVQFSLQEHKEIKIGTLQRIKVALEWTIKIYLKLITIVTFLMLFIYLLLRSVEKLKLFEKMINRNQ